MVGIEINLSLVPLDFVGIADTPADGVEDGHDDATSEHQDPREQEQVRDEDEDHTG